MNILERALYNTRIVRFNTAYTTQVWLLTSSFDWHLSRNITLMVTILKLNWNKMVHILISYHKNSHTISFMLTTYLLF